VTVVVATADFELYHDLVAELRSRDVRFTTVEPGASLPDGATAVLSGPDDPVGALPADVDHVVATPGEARPAVDEALTRARGTDERVVVGIDPGDRPGIAVLVGDVVVAAFHVPEEQAASVVEREVADAPDPLVRIGDGARLAGSRIVDDLPDVPIELVDETGTTPYLGTGARGMGDVLAAVNIARLSGEAMDTREIDPTAGELQRIKDRSRQESSDDRTIDEGLARRVAAGELTVDEALATHRERDGGESEGSDNR
jgi:hypothetical protein